MPLKAAAAPKRKVSHSSASSTSGGHSSKKSRTATTTSSIVFQHYPPEMSNQRAQAYIDGDLPKPIDELTDALEETAAQMHEVDPKDAMVHWFKSDLRTLDNRALAMASEKAQMAGVPLIGLYVVSPQDWEAHLTAPVRVDFVLRTLAVLQRDLAELGIPLWMETVEQRKQIPHRILSLMDKWGANHLFANMEYEVDELRRETAMVRQCAAQGKSMAVVHDICVVPPGNLTSKSSGKAYAVYTPWFRAWKQHVYTNEHILGPIDNPKTQAKTKTRWPAELMDCPIPSAPKGKTLGTKAEAKRFCTLWPAGEHEAMRRLEHFCDERVADYSDERDFPAVEATSSLSPYLAAGVLSARTVIRTARDRTGAKTLDDGTEGFRVWISEVSWRDFYRHILVAWPHVCFNKPFKLAYSGIAWSYNHDHFTAWTEGRTGYPIVDAAMRQLNKQGWLHNRCRMIVASFLAKDLLLDWRLGERYFMEHLVDGDFASNSGGWGFSASVGVDPQPYFRIFNPILQSERFDPDGTYIRRWVPELQDSGIADNKAIHEPYGRGFGDQARAAGYPEPIVQHKQAREAALEAYKKALSGN
ncbi:deoxyribodipyrimidine photo-lyase [Grosmannia clavigera kw1407]|uniref:Deoxyribodipyrimidine photo-lyase n=1 Tax=Grosmannia clavigera (strain kw1407 / UAMH 11150) TaxID=655863 RepID=F0XUK7_GROCL|nr:deoxyribodipyrimidine photo-lyase [Grosmannia clavigera kw1407]EFW98409.1 deoxyribodipyrimidine photo-lyase [Grosmannia clavigera kw1407]